MVFTRRSLFKAAAAVALAFRVVQALAAPRLTAVVVSPRRIDLEWNSVPGARSYQVRRNGVVIVRNHPRTTYSDLSVLPRTTYTYRVGAVP